MRRFEPYDDYEDDEPAEPHSGLGIASFVLTLGAGLIVVGLIALAGIIEATRPAARGREPPPVEAVAGLGVALAFNLDVIGLALGVAGLSQRRRRKAFALAGVIIGALVLLGCLFLIVVGAVMDG
jgi:hypothetical protein